ncbi:MAG: galactose/methyl galactoside ABC transporter permease MglC [Bacilli bacterium]
MDNKKMKKLLWDSAIYIVLLALIIVIIVTEPSFLSLKNFENIFKQSSTKLIISLGVAGIIITQGTDLSAGRQVGLAALVSASLLQMSTYATKYYPNLALDNGFDVFLVILGVMAITAVISGANGFIVSKLNVTPFVATLGMMTIVFGINNIYFEKNPHGATPISGFIKQFKTLATGEIFGFIPIIVLIAIVTTIIVYILWNHTKFGKNMYAIGGNPEAAQVSGVNIILYTVLVYMLGGALYGLAGALEAARITSVSSTFGNMYELDAIAAAVVGGVSFSGGVGKVQGVIAGVLIFAVISYGLTYIGITPFVQMIIKGVIIILAVAIDAQKNKIST